MIESHSSLWNESYLNMHEKWQMFEKNDNLIAKILHNTKILQNYNFIVLSEKAI